jgi:hypothetical protein
VFARGFALSPGGYVQIRAGAGTAFGFVVREGRQEGAKMSGISLEYPVGGSSEKPSLNLVEYAGQIEKLANDLDKSGWRAEANYLRKWSLELKEKSARVIEAGTAV